MYVVTNMFAWYWKGVNNVNLHAINGKLLASKKCKGTISQFRLNNMVRY